MGILDRLFGQQPASPPGDAQRAPQEISDEQALQRYRYLVRTAPPEAIEEAHREAFARLTPEQRAQVLQELNAAAPAAQFALDAFQRLIPLSVAYRSMSFSSPAENSSFSSAPTFCSSWATLLAPIRVEVTRGSRKVQASAICASVWPRRLAI